MTDLEDLERGAGSRFHLMEPIRFAAGDYSLDLAEVGTPDDTRHFSLLDDFAQGTTGPALYTLNPAADIGSKIVHDLTEIFQLSLTTNNFEQRLGLEASNIQIPETPTSLSFGFNLLTPQSPDKGNTLAEVGPEFSGFSANADFRVRGIGFSLGFGERSPHDFLRPFNPLQDKGFIGLKPDYVPRTLNRQDEERIKFSSAALHVGPYYIGAYSEGGTSQLQVGADLGITDSVTLGIKGFHDISGHRDDLGSLGGMERQIGVLSTLDVRF